MPPVRVLILGHSFIRRLREFLASHVSLNTNFLLAEYCEIKWHGIGGRTVSKVRDFDLGIVEIFRPDIVILQLGSNDLVDGDPLSIASAIEDLVTLLHDSFQVKRVCVCQTLYRVSSPAYNQRVRDLIKYLKVLLEPLPYSLYWKHRGFWNSTVGLYSGDGVHLNARGHYRLYRSLRGAVLRSLHSLHNSTSKHS